MNNNIKSPVTCPKCGKLDFIILKKYLRCKHCCYDIRDKEKTIIYRNWYLLVNEMPLEDS